MPLPLSQIPEAVLRGVRLVVTDVDGTLTPADGGRSRSAEAAIGRLEEAGIAVGFASGRTLPGLERLAERVGSRGPLIAENGAVARYYPGGELVDLGYPCQVARDALDRLKSLFPGIREREDNRERLVDVVFFPDGLPVAQLQAHLSGVEVVDSGYITHLVPRGVSKGGTLRKLLAGLSPPLGAGSVLVVGDSPTDVSLFELFPNSVFVPNPRLSPAQRREAAGAARYATESECDAGFVELACRLLRARASPGGAT